MYVDVGIVLRKLFFIVVFDGVDLGCVGGLLLVVVECLV